MRLLHVGDDHAGLRPCGLTFYSDALMRSLAARGHEVAYFYSGRHYPWPAGPRLKRGRLGPVRTFELIGSPNHAHWELGNRRPERDVEDAAAEAAFASALREARPDVVHVHELARLPSSVIVLAREAGVPVVMTLHDYKPLCASVRLLDADGRRCMRHDVGEDCARNCAGAPHGPAHLVERTLTHDLTRAKRAVPGLRALDFRPVDGLVAPIKRRLSRSPQDGAAAEGTPPEHYQRRREVNVERLSLCDRLLAPSTRAAEIYARLGVDPGGIHVQPLTLPHVEHLRPGPDAGVGSPMVFAVLGAAAHPSKGSRQLVEAVEALERAGRGGDFELAVHGRVEPGVYERLRRAPSVSLRGSYAIEDLDRVLDQADVGLMPSVWEETFGFAGVEMLAKGVPLIGSALGAIPEYVREGETGWLNRSAGGAELAELMAHAIDDPAGVERLRRSVRSRRPQLAMAMAEHVGEVEGHYGEVVREVSVTRVA